MGAQKIAKQTRYAKQSGLGVIQSTGGQVLRRRNSVFNKAVDTAENDEVNTHQQSTGANVVFGRTTGRLEAILSPGTYADLFANLLRKDFAATAAITGAGVTIAGTGPTYTLTRAAGSFLTDGIKAFDVIRLSVGALNAANINKNLLVLSVNSATSLTVMTVNGSALAAEGPITGTTITVPGKKVWAPTTGHVNGYLTVEERFTDLQKSEVFQDVKVASAEISVPATGNTNVTFDMPGLKRTRPTGTTSNFASPAAESTSPALGAGAFVCVVNGVVTPVTGLTCTVNGGVQAGAAEAGTDSASDLTRGTITVSGQFTAKFNDTLIQDVFDDQSTIAIGGAIPASKLAAADFVAFVMSRAKILGDANDDNAEIIRTYNYTAEINGAGGAALANHQTIFSMQDSLAA